jgi:hypothetical protein
MVGDATRMELLLVQGETTATESADVVSWLLD